jgi:hypothetical protein
VVIDGEDERDQHTLGAQQLRHACRPARAQVGRQRAEEGVVPNERERRAEGVFEEVASDKVNLPWCQAGSVAALGCNVHCGD